MIPIALILVFFSLMPLYFLNTRFLKFTNVVGDHWFDRQSIEQDICLHINKCRCIIKYALEHNFFKLKVRKTEKKENLFCVYLAYVSSFWCWTLLCWATWVWLLFKSNTSLSYALSKCFLAKELIKFELSRLFRINIAT